MSGVILEWKTRLFIDNRYSLSKAKPEPECPSRGSVMRARAVPLCTYLRICACMCIYSKEILLVPHTGAQRLTIHLCIVHARYLSSLLHQRLVYLMFFLFFFFFFVFSLFFWFHSSSGVGRDTESRFLRVTQPPRRSSVDYFSKSRESRIFKWWLNETGFSLPLYSSLHSLSVSLVGGSLSV